MKSKYKNGIREYIYKRLVEEFGSYEQWEPNVKSSKKYKDTLISIAAYCSKETDEHFSPKAIKQQIEFAITKQPKFRDGHVAQAFYNKCAAVQCGFISSGYLPKKILAEY